MAEPAPPPGAEAPTGPVTPAAPATPARRRRPLVRLAAALLALAAAVLLGLAGGAAWLWRQPAALPWLLARVPGLAVQGVQGTLAEGRLRIDALDWQLPGQAGRLRLGAVAVDGLALRWHPRPGSWLALQAQRVQAARLDFDSGPPSTTPLAPPATLRLPLDLAVDALAIDRLRIDALPLLQGLRARLTLGADQGARHRVDELALTLDAGTAEAPAPLQLQGGLTLGADAPLALQAALQLRRDGGAWPWQARLQAQGPLAGFDAEAVLRGAPAAGPAAASAPTGAGPALRAEARLQPFAAWPLAALTLHTDALDLAALSPRWPRTRLAGRAAVASAGLDQPVAVDATLHNALPGPWDAGRLPLAALQLQARGALRTGAPLSLQRFELRLADERGSAGTLAGQGRWQADALALDLQLERLQPARLHRRAAALQLGGPLTLRVDGLPWPPAAAGTGTGTDTRTAATAAGSPGSSPARAGGAAPAPAAPIAPRSAPRLALEGRLEGRLLDGPATPVRLQLALEADAASLRLLRAQAQAGGAQASASGLARADATGWQLQGQAALRDFDPRPWWRGGEGSAWRRGPHRVNGQATLDLQGPPRPAGAGLWATLAGARGQAALTLQDSLLAGVPLAGSATLQGTAPAAALDAQAVLAGNRLTLQGQRAARADDDRWQLALQAPALPALAPLAALLAELAPEAAGWWPRSGALTARVDAEGRWPALRSRGQLQAQGLAVADGAVQHLALDWTHGGGAEAPLSATVQTQGLALQGQRLDTLRAEVQGSLRTHTLALRADSPRRPPAWTEHLLGPAGTGTRVEAEARGGWQAGAAGGGGGRYRWQDGALRAGARDAQGGSRPWLAAQGLAGELALDADGAPRAAQLAPGRVQLLDTALNWRTLRWQAGSGQPGDPGLLELAATLETFDLAQLLARAQPDMGWGGQLTLGGRIDVRSGERFDADIVLERLAGDLQITDELGAAQALGLTELRLALTAHDGLWQFAQGLAGRRLGTIVGAQVLRGTPQQRWPAPGTPLQGVLDLHVGDLGVWGTWVPPGWRLSGALDASAQVSGTLGAAQLRGEVRGRDLGVRNLLQGVDLRDGQLALTLDGDSARVERFDFRGGDGRLTLSGGATLGARPQATLRLAAERFRVLGRIDRRIVASGSATLALDTERLKLDGSFTVDEGLIDIGHGDAPTLDSDVVVHRDGADPAAARPGPAPLPRPLREAQVALRIGLGERLRLRGQGVDTGLRGDLLVSSPGGRLALNGTVQAHDGRYAAYGQKLEITRGVLTFTGAMDNPRLDILAVRPNLDVLVGVLIDGAAASPRIRLYSEPELADYDKLSWLVMGRSPDGLGSTDTALLQRAAFALLAGGDRAAPTDQLVEALGLTDFSLRQTESNNTRETIVSLGKQLSRRWYVGYERGVNATTGTWQLVYRIAQRFTLRAQSGSENALDLIWTWRW